MGEWKETELGKIPKEWDFFSVGELIEQSIIEKPLDGNHGGIHPKGTDFVDKGIPFIMATDIKNGKVDLVNCKFITKKQADSLNKGFAITDDVLLTHKASLGRTAIVGEIETPYIMLTPQVTYYRVKDKNKLNNTYLKYFFDSPAFQDTLLNHGDSGSTRAYVGITAQRDLPVCLPLTPVQKAIVSVLSSLDEKIDLLHRQNKTLEAMAETLFRQWFVEEAQEDWEEVDLEHVTKRITDGAHKSPPTVNVGLPMASVKDMHDWGFHIKTCRKIAVEDYNELVRNDCRPLKNDIIIAKDGSYLKHVFVSHEDLAVVILSSIAILRPNDIYDPILLSILLKLDSVHAALENIVTGAVIPRIVLKDFRKFLILLPPKHLQLEALGKIKPLISKCSENVKQIHTSKNSVTPCSPN